MKTFRDSLLAGPQLGLVNMYPAPGILERIGPDWDWIWIDGQHGQMGYGDLLAAVRVCNVIDRPAVVRVPGHDSGWIGLALDTAADGVMVPMVDTVEQARGIVQSAKFPPLGSRSYGGRRPVDLRGRNYSHTDRPQPLLICQIETPVGIANAESIAAVAGVDALFFGADDVAMRVGLAMDQPRPAGYFDANLEAVAQAALQHGKFAGGIFFTPDDLQKAVGWGYRLIVGSGDVTILAGGSQSKAQSLRTSLAATNIPPRRTTDKPVGVY